MKTLTSYLDERLAIENKGHYEVRYFKNPTLLELEHMEDENRGLILPNGDLFIQSAESLTDDQGYVYIHSDLVSWLQRNKYINTDHNPSFIYDELEETLEDFLLVNRARTEPTKFLLGESYTPGEIKRYRNSLKKYKIAAKKKNPHLQFDFTIHE